MAIDPSVTYLSQIDTSDLVGWPYGRAKNESTPGARNGTPFEQIWLSDLWGFKQALLKAANLTPSGNPDKASANADASQYLQAIRALNFSLMCQLPSAVHALSYFTPSLVGLVQTQFAGSFVTDSQVNIPLGPFPHSTAERRTYLKAVDVYIKPVGHAAMPAEKPGFRIYRTTTAGSLSVNGDVFLDPSVAIGTYNVAHVIPGALSTALEITPDMALSVGFWGEYGANATTGLQVLGVSCLLSDRPV